MAKKRPKLDTPSYTPAQIRRVREDLGLSVAEAAERIGVQARTWLSWELPSQKRSPTASHMKLIRLLAQRKI